MSDWLTLVHEIEKEVIVNKDLAFIIIEENEMYIDKVREYRVYFDGRVTGLTNKHYVINYALPVLLKMQALEKEREEDKRYIEELEKRSEELENGY